MLVIFDWDGTLSDSTGKIVRCMQLAASELGEPVLPDEAVREIIGLSLPRAVSQLYPSLSEAGVEALAQEYSRQYVADDHKPGFYQGALEVLEQLAAEGFLLAVATGKSRKGLDRNLRDTQLMEAFHATRCADETASKPDPLMLRELLRECERHHEQAVMVGDTEFDLAMAKAIDMPRVGVNYGAHHPSRLRAHDPVMCVDDLREMVPWLLNARG